MKKIVLFVLLALVSGCASGPTHIIVKNCKDLGYNLYNCEELPKNTTERKNF